MAIRNELKTLSPPCKREGHQEEQSIPGTANKKHNLQILGKKKEVGVVVTIKKPINRRYQECSSLDRSSTIIEHSTVTAISSSIVATGAPLARITA